MAKAATSLVDKELSTLGAVLDPVELGNHLRPVLPTKWGALLDIQVQLLRHFPGKRCTIKITILTATGKYELIGKLYRRDRSDVFQAMDQIRLAGFGAEEAYSIPQPLVYLPLLNLLLYERVCGPRAKDFFGRDNEEHQALLAQRCALWLARFHSIAPESTRSISLRDQLIVCHERAQRVAGLGNSIAAKALKLSEQLEAAASGLSEVDTCAVHGNYRSGHVILSNGRTVVIDWDRHSVGAPARDVATFNVEMRRTARARLGSMRALDNLVTVFVRNYFDRNKLKVKQQLPFYEAATCLKIAGRLAGLPVRRSHGGYDEVNALLNEGLRSLEVQLA